MAAINFSKISFMTTQVSHLKLRRMVVVVARRRVESGLVMHQYQCNGVLAGIAICRKGFPNKVLYPEFKSRYNILAAAAVAKAKNDKAAASAVLDAIKLEPEKYRLGHTKVFFRAGILGFMEEVREDKIGDVVTLLTAQA